MELSAGLCLPCRRAYLVPFADDSISGGMLLDIPKVFKIILSTRERDMKKYEEEG